MTEASIMSSVSSFFGGEVLAQTKPTDYSEYVNNSQNMALLKPNSSFVPDRSDDNVTIDIVSDSALRPNTPYDGGIGGEEFSFDGEIEIYVVRTGDTAAIVAELFGVSTDTILSANNLVKGDKLKTGDVLLILPFSGVEHTVAKDETLKGIASKYKVDLENILSANDLDINYKLVIGEQLMVPGANILKEVRPKTSTGNLIGKVVSKVSSIAGYFINPVPKAIKSRGVKPGHKGVDWAISTGTPIHASAGGVVLIARNGYNGGFGIYVVIQHPNGTKTLYAHMSKLGTTPGAQVSQGAVIGYVGSTGHSTGPHLHFEVLGGKNPF